jgi:histidinol-phosphate/aromatic aminotransferase/cobyric acid decarboxylase-like protein
MPRHLWYHPFYDNDGILNLSNNVCYDQILINDLNTSLDLKKIFEYPDPFLTYVTLSNFLNINIKNIAIGFGASDIIHRLFDFFRDHTIGILTPTYDLSISFAENLYINFKKSNNLDELKTDILYIVNPNGINGKALFKEDLLKISENYKYMIIDEAYSDFCNGEISLLNDSINKNIIVIKTFSKTISVPGLRFGYCVSNQQFIKDFQERRSAVIITGITQQFIPFLIEQIPYHVKRMMITKKYIEEKYSCVPSNGNFVLFKTDPNFNCKIKKTEENLFRMALIDLDTFKKIENGKDIS